MKSEVRKAVGVFLALSGLIGVVVQILSLSGALRTASLIAVFGLLTALGLWVFVSGVTTKRRAHKALPEIETIEDICTTYRALQATIEEMDWISTLEHNVYSAVDAVPREVLLEWYGTNPRGFSVIKMPNNAKVGHIDLLPIRPATFERFFSGAIVEREIRGDSLYSAAEREKITSLYVESIILCPPKGFSNAPAILCVLSAFEQLAARLCDPERLENVFAIAASRSGERLLRRLGFDIIKAADARKDGHDLFMAPYGELRRNIAAICSSRFPDPPEPGQTLERDRTEA